VGICDVVLEKLAADEILCGADSKSACWIMDLLMRMNTGLDCMAFGFLHEKDEHR